MQVPPKRKGERCAETATNYILRKDLARKHGRTKQLQMAHHTKEQNCR